MQAFAKFVRVIQIPRLPSLPNPQSPHLTFSMSHLSIAGLVTSLFGCSDTLSDAVTSCTALIDIWISRPNSPVTSFTDGYPDI